MPQVNKIQCQHLIEEERAPTHPINKGVIIGLSISLTVGMSTADSIVKEIGYVLNA